MGSHEQVEWAKSLNDEFLNEQQYRMNQVGKKCLCVVGWLWWSIDRRMPTNAKNQHAR